MSEIQECAVFPALLLCGSMRGLVGLTCVFSVTWSSSIEEAVTVGLP